MLNKLLDCFSLVAIVINLWMLWFGYQHHDKSLQLLAIANMILLSLGLLFNSKPKKEDK